MTEVTIIGFGTAVILYLVDQLKLKDVKIDKLEVKVDRLSNLLLNAVTAIKEPHNNKRDQIANEIISDLKDMLPDEPKKGAVK